VITPRKWWLVGKHRLSNAELEAEFLKDHYRETGAVPHIQSSEERTAEIERLWSEDNYRDPLVDIEAALNMGPAPPDWDYWMERLRWK